MVSMGRNYFSSPYPQRARRPGGRRRKRRLHNYESALSVSAALPLEHARQTKSPRRERYAAQKGSRSPTGRERDAFSAEKDGVPSAQHTRAECRNESPSLFLILGVQFEKNLSGSFSIHAVFTGPTPKGSAHRRNFVAHEHFL